MTKHDKTIRTQLHVLIHSIFRVPSTHFARLATVDASGRGSTLKTAPTDPTSQVPRPGTGTTSEGYSGGRVDIPNFHSFQGTLGRHKSVDGLKVPKSTKGTQQLMEFKLPRRMLTQISSVMQNSYGQCGLGSDIYHSKHRITHSSEHPNTIYSSQNDQTKRERERGKKEKRQGNLQWPSNPAHTFPRGGAKGSPRW